MWRRGLSDGQEDAGLFWASTSIRTATDGDAVEVDPASGRASPGPSQGPHPVARPTVMTDPAWISEVIELALSDHVTFSQIQQQYGLNADEVQDLMRRHLKRGSYVAWRKRVRFFSDRREHYK